MPGGPRRSSASLSDMLASDPPPEHRYGEAYQSPAGGGGSGGRPSRDPLHTSTQPRSGQIPGGGAGVVAYPHLAHHLRSSEAPPMPPYSRHPGPSYPQSSSYYESQRAPPPRQRSDPVVPYHDRDRHRSSGGSYYDEWYNSYPPPPPRRERESREGPYIADDQHGFKPMYAPPYHSQHPPAPSDLRPPTASGYPPPSGSGPPQPGSYALSPPSLRAPRMDSRQGGAAMSTPPACDVRSWPRAVAEAYHRGYDEAMANVAEGSITIDGAVYHRVPLVYPDRLRERPDLRDDDHQRFRDRPPPGAEYVDRGGGHGHGGIPGSMVGGPPPPQRPPSVPHRYGPEDYSPAPQAPHLPPYYTASPHSGGPPQYTQLHGQHYPPPGHPLPMVDGPPPHVPPVPLPPLMRHRQVISCHPCRSRKVKCSGGKPCDACIKIKRTGECEYEKAVRRRGKGRKRSEKSEGEGDGTGSEHDWDDPSAQTTTHGSDRQRSGGGSETGRDTGTQGHSQSQDDGGGASGSDAPRELAPASSPTTVIAEPVRPRSPPSPKKRRESTKRRESSPCASHRDRDRERRDDHPDSGVGAPAAAQYDDDRVSKRARKRPPREPRVSQDAAQVGTTSSATGGIVRGGMSAV